MRVESGASTPSLLAWSASLPLRIRSPSRSLPFCSSGLSRICIGAGLTGQNWDARVGTKIEISYRHQSSVEALEGRCEPMLLSIVIPVYNEAGNLQLTLRALQTELGKVGCDAEIVFVNDGSSDESQGILAGFAAADSAIKVLNFSRNFGHQAAITAGLDFAAGDAVVIMDADLQDPPEILADMVKLYQQGYDVVSAQRVSREGEGIFKRLTASAFYWIMQRAVDRRIVPEVGDFRLLSRAAVLALRRFREQHRFMRGLVAWLGLKEAILPFRRQPRAAGETKYTLFKMIRLAWTAVASFSALPLRLSIAAGVVLSLAGFGYFLYALYAAVVLGAVVPGWTSLVFLQCLFSGVTLLALGLIGDYVARIYEEIKNRPLYVVSEILNAGQAAPAAAGAVVLTPRQADLPTDEVRRKISAKNVR